MRLLDIVENLYQGREVFTRTVRTVADMMTISPYTLHPDDPIRDAAVLFKKYQIRHVPLAHSGYLVGVVSDRDLLRVYSKGYVMGEVPVRDIDAMTHETPLAAIATPAGLSVSPSQSIYEAVEIMMNRRIDCLPVVQPDKGAGKLVGILTTTDIVKCFLLFEFLRLARRGATSRRWRLMDLAYGLADDQPTDMLLGDEMSRATDVLSNEIPIVSADETIESAIQKIRRSIDRHVVVLDSCGKLEGILSDRDILRELPPPSLPLYRIEGSVGTGRLMDHLLPIKATNDGLRDAFARPVVSIMTKKPKTVVPEAGLDEIVEHFLTNRFGAMPVVDNDGTTIGLVSEVRLLSAVIALGRVFNMPAIGTPDTGMSANF